MKPWFAEIRYNQKLNDSVFAICLAPVEGSEGNKKISSAEAGQFYMVGLPGHLDPLLRRPFSHFRLKKHDGKDCLELIYEKKGRGTRILSALKPGELLSLIGPLGQGFKIQYETKRVVMVAGGLGVVPVLSLLGSMMKLTKQNAIDFIWGVRTRRDFFRMDELKGLYKALGPGMNVLLATEDGSYDHKGTATELLEEILEDKGDGVQVFACGPLAMLRRIVEIAGEGDVGLQFSMEEKMACGFGACLGCAVPANAGGYLHVCKDGPVFDPKLIDWEKI